MKSISTPQSILQVADRAPASETPSVVHGLAYGIAVSAVIWLAIGAIVYQLT